MLSYSNARDDSMARCAGRKYSGRAADTKKEGLFFKFLSADITSSGLKYATIQVSGELFVACDCSMVVDLDWMGRW